MTRKIAVMGGSCSGKTTFSRRLAEKLDVPHVELDALHHGPNWAEPTVEDFRARVGQAIAGDGWVVDGSYGGKLGDMVIAQADLVVWLDLPLRTVLPRLWRRTLHRIRNDVELWNGNRETWRDAFLSRHSLFIWVVTTHRRRRRTLPVELEPFEAVRLRSPEEVEAWLAEV